MPFDDRSAKASFRDLAPVPPPARAPADRARLEAAGPPTPFGALVLHATGACSAEAHAPRPRLCFDGAAPGPILVVAQGAATRVACRNGTDRSLALRFDPALREAPDAGRPGRGVLRVAPGATDQRLLRWPEPGAFWYHARTRVDAGRTHGLYGAVVVRPTDAAYWPPADREFVAVLDDAAPPDAVAAHPDGAAPATHPLARFGAVVRVNGVEGGRYRARVGEVVRFYLLNATRTRALRISLPGARLKLVGGDVGRVEREAWVEEVALAPLERAVVDVFLERPAALSLVHRAPGRPQRLAALEVAERGAAPGRRAAFETLRYHPEFEPQRVRLRDELARPPDATFRLAGPPEPPEATGAAASVPPGVRAKVRLRHAASAGRLAHHLVHAPRARFLILARDGVPNDVLAWKQTLLLRAGEEVDLLLEPPEGRAAVALDVCAPSGSGSPYRLRVRGRRGIGRSSP